MVYLDTASFSIKDVELTADALMFFGYGIIAFALIKVLSNFFSREILLRHLFTFHHLSFV